MALTRSRLALATVMLSGLTAALGFGCADVDPRYGPPQVIKGREVDFGFDSGAAPPPVEAGKSTKSATELFADLFVTLTDQTKAKGSTCLPCHQTTQVPVFMGATAEETRAKFKTNNFTSVTSRFYLKGQHSGDPLKPAQQVLFQQWVAAEAGGGTPPADAGGGG